MTWKTLPFVFGVVALACSPAGDETSSGDGDGDTAGDGDTTGDGGTAGSTGGTTGSGGDGTSTGGFVGDGDVPATGGIVSTGGVPGTGGVLGDGGTPATGGTDLGTGGADPATGGTDPGTGGAASGCTPNPGGTSVDQGDGTFVDERTCLMWMKEVFPNSGDFIGRDHVADCVNATTAGYSDWRGPDAAEMVSLLRLDGATCGQWHSPNLWDSQLNTSELNEPVMFYTATEGDGQGSEHQCAIDGSFATLNGGTRKNPWSVVCVRGTSPITGTIAECVGTACDYSTL